MNFDKFLTAQNVLPEFYSWYSTETAQGFNIRVYGGDYGELSKNRISSSGFDIADNLINEGRIFFVHPFKCDRNDKCPTRFQYGGFWACNTCNTHIDTPDWWIIKVMKDGNAWCCIGEGFVNLQESDNYAFGSTRIEAIENYRLLFTKQKAA